jgi:AcrR family transcriptional regulator
MSPRPRLSDDETEEYARRLIEAAFRVVAATGDVAPSIRPILQEAGLSRQAFYRCFGSKDELMAVVLADGQRILADYLAARMSRSESPAGKVDAWVSGVMRQAEVASAADRTRPFIVASERWAGLDEPGGPGPGAERALSGLLADAIAAGVADGCWASDDPGGDALIIHDFVFASLRRHLLQHVAPSPDTTRALVGFALRALGARVNQPAD